MNIRQRLTRLEARLSKGGMCEACRDGQAAEVVMVRHGEAAPPTRPCPHCGREQNQMVILLFA